jgi:hypothetical protein
MFLREVVMGLLAMLIGSPAAAPEDVAVGRYYGGVEWILDENGNLLGSEEVTLERHVDLGHSVFTRRVVRDARGGRAVERREEFRLVSLSPKPHRLEARAVAGDVRIELSETLRRGVLVARQTHRAHDGRVLEVHILDATPLSASEAEARASVLASRTRSVACR